MIPLWKSPIKLPVELPVELHMQVLLLAIEKSEVDLASGTTFFAFR